MALSDKPWTDLFRTRKRLDQLIKSADPEQTIPIKLKHFKDIVWDFEHLPPIPPLTLHDGVLTGGRVTWIQNYDYEVSAAVYVIGGQLYSSPLTMITLDTADPALDRIDTFVLTTDGTAEAITGTPGASPLEPDIDFSTQVRIAFALVQAGTTSPTIVNEWIYQENIEWVTAVSNASWNPNSTSNPYAGTKTIEGTNVGSGHSITFTPATFPSIVPFESFVFKIRPKASWGNQRLVFQFRNGTTPIGNAISFGNGTFGFVSTNPGYQNINIPMSSFGNVAAATNLRIIKSGGGTIGFYLDDIQMVSDDNVVQLPQVNADWAATSGDAQILNKSITRTVVQMQALADAGTLDTNMWYIISNPASSFGVLRIRARDASNLEKTGTLIKGGKSYTVDYSLDDGANNDVFTYLRDHENNNTVYQFFDDTAGIISLIPFNSTWNSSVFYGVTATISNVSKVGIASSRFNSGCTLTLDHNGSADAAPIQIVGTDLGPSCGLTMVADSAGGTVQVTDLSVRGSSSVSLDETCSVLSTIVDNSSSLTVDDNGADNSTAVNSCVVNGNSIVTVQGIAGGVGTTLTGCQILGLRGSVTIKGGETYENKSLSKSVSTFTGNRTIAGDGAYSFTDSSLVASYDRSFIGRWTITAVAPRNVTSFSDRTADFEHEVTFSLAAGSSPITFVDDGVAVIMKGSADAVLTAEGDYVTFRFVGNVGFEVDRGIY